MSENEDKIKLPKNLYNEILEFFRRTSMPRIRKKRKQGREKEQSANPSD